MTNNLICYFPFGFHLPVSKNESGVSMYVLCVGLWTVTLPGRTYLGKINKSEISVSTNRAVICVMLNLLICLLLPNGSLLPKARVVSAVPTGAWHLYALVGGVGDTAFWMENLPCSSLSARLKSNVSSWRTYWKDMLRVYIQKQYAPVWWGFQDEFRIHLEAHTMGSGWGGWDRKTEEYNVLNASLVWDH